MQPEEIIREGVTGAYSTTMYIMAGIVAFLFIIAISKNIPDIIHNLIIGWSIKLFKKYQIGDVFTYGDKDWVLFKLNGINLTFKHIVSRVEGGVTTSKRKKTLQYAKFIKDSIETTGEKY